MFRKMMFFVVLFVFSATTFTYGQVVPTPPDWKEWSTHPKVPTMTPDQIQQLILRGDNTILIYAGYMTDKIICGSVHVPYNLTPPFGDGRRVNPKFPTDAWLVAYCP